MKHTANYTLNQWDAADRILRTDFNADNQRIDAALKALADGKASASALSSLSSTVSGKASASSVAALTNRVSSLETGSATKTEVSAVEVAGLRIATGSYTGTGNYGANYARVIDCSSTIGRPPKLAIIQPSAEDDLRVVLIYGASRFNGHGTVIWRGNSVVWYSDSSAVAMMNSINVSYVWAAIG